MKKFNILLALPLILSTNTFAQQPPNILLINIDDMGWRDVGFMGSEYYETPNLDALATDGMIFTNAYASASNCAPSRACMMRGQWPSRHDIFTVGNSVRG
jgi:arylsulfatase A-like enzyme